MTVGVIITRYTELQTNLAVEQAMARRRPTLDAASPGLMGELGADARSASSEYENRPMSTIDQAVEVGADLVRFAAGRRFATLIADPPWQFVNRTGKMAPEHKRLNRYATLTTEGIARLPFGEIVAAKAHLYLWVPNALLPDGLRVMAAWGFDYKTNIVWEKVRRDGGPDGRGVGFYFRNVTELLLFGTRGRNNRTLAPGRRQVNFIATRKREHSRKPDEQYAIIEACSPGPYLELFARGQREGWVSWGNQADQDYRPTWKTYANHSQDQARRP